MFACVCVSAIAFLVILNHPECIRARLSGGGSNHNLLTSSTTSATLSETCPADGNSNVAYVPELGDNPKSNQVCMDVFQVIIII